MGLLPSLNPPGRSLPATPGIRVRNVIRILCGSAKCVRQSGWQRSPNRRRQHHILDDVLDAVSNEPTVDASIEVMEPREHRSMSDAPTLTLRCDVWPMRNVRRHVPHWMRYDPPRHRMGGLGGYVRTGTTKVSRDMGTCLGPDLAYRYAVINSPIRVAHGHRIPVVDLLMMAHVGTQTEELALLIQGPTEARS